MMRACERVCGLNSFEVCFNVEINDMWEGNVIRSKI